MAFTKFMLQNLRKVLKNSEEKEEKYRFCSTLRTTARQKKAAI